MLLERYRQLQRKIFELRGHDTIPVEDLESEDTEPVRWALKYPFWPYFVAYCQFLTTECFGYYLRSFCSFGQVEPPLVSRAHNITYVEIFQLHFLHKGPMVFDSASITHFMPYALMPPASYQLLWHHGLLLQPKTILQSLLKYQQSKWEILFD